jgi:hypothetical protein
MKKADYKAFRTRREEMNYDSSQSPTASWYWRDPSNRPIFIPKRKKKK